MKKYIIGAALALSSTTVLADVSGSVNYASDYLFRGISQSNGEAAIQGELRFDTEAGVYASVWGSVIDFEEGLLDADAGSLELDYTVGFANQIGSLRYDIGVVYYDYPGADDSSTDFYEVFGGLGTDFGNLAVDGKVSYSDDYFGGSGKALYSEVGMGYPIGPATLVAHVGYSEFDNDALTDYMDYSIGLEAKILGLDTGVHYVNTNLNDNDDCGSANICDSTVMFTVGLSF